jgi:hypothetical protein
VRTGRIAFSVANGAASSVRSTEVVRNRGVTVAIRQRGEVSQVTSRELGLEAQEHRVALLQGTLQLGQTGNSRIQGAVPLEPLALVLSAMFQL